MSIILRMILPVIIIAVAFPAQAEDVPRFDIALYCQANASARGGPGNCRRTEETQRIALEADWQSFPKQRKHFCVQSVTFKPRAQRSYATLAQCLEDGTTS
ncbi:MAG: hypothetical protein NTZ14_05630 [Hyphomicrobiales bacterium]|nr:hypothetical protein [Hyphomicrobiales bacterium]